MNHGIKILKRIKGKHYWYDILQFFFILLTTTAIPINWRYGLFVIEMLAVVTLIKIVAQRKLGNPSLNGTLRLVLLGPVIYWALLAISLLWSNDTFMGLKLLERTVVLFIFPLCFLLSDTSYLTERHLLSIGEVLIVAICGAFLYFIFMAGEKIAHGESFVSFYNDYFSHSRIGYRHHSYIALYATVAMVSSYYELSSYWGKLRVGHRLFLIISLPVLISYIVLVNSRAGIMVAGMMAIVCLLHFSIKKRSWMFGVGMAILIVITFWGSMRVFPSYKDRLSTTITNYSEVEKDGRIKLYKCNWAAYLKSPWIGYGIGDYRAVQVNTYKEYGFYDTAAIGYNAHNQYLESLMAAGIWGLLALLFFILSPLIVAFRRKQNRFLITSMVCIVAINLLFESMLERMMGLIFIGGLYSVMVLALSVKKNNQFV